MDANARRSIQELSAEVATNPDSAAFVELVAAYRQLGDLDRALRLCLRGIARHPTHVEAHFELGRVYRARGERELALDEWSIVRSLAPDHIGALREAAELYLEEGQLEQALGELERALEIAPDDPELRELSGRLPGPEPSVNGARGAVAAEAEAEPADPPAAEAAAPASGPGPEVLGTLLVDERGEVLAAEGSLSDGAAVPLGGDELGAVREEAKRVAGYLGLGDWSEMTVEGEDARWTIRPLGRGVLVVCTDPGLPPGRAARLVERVSERMKGNGGARSG